MNAAEVQEGGRVKKAAGSRRQVYNGTAKHTPGGLQSEDLKKNKEGKLVSKAASDAGKKNFKHISQWHALVMKVYNQNKAKGEKGADALSKAMKQAKALYKRK
jgi:hypothetical protein